MRTYIKLKILFIFEDYLSITNEQHHKSMSRLKISTHMLYIHHPSNPSRNKTICKHYHGNQVDDESHFLLDCQKYTSSRVNLYIAIGSISKQFSKLEILINVFTCWVLVQMLLNMLQHLFMKTYHNNHEIGWYWS